MKKIWGFFTRHKQTNWIYENKYLYPLCHKHIKSYFCMYERI